MEDEQSDISDFIRIGNLSNPEAHLLYVRGVAGCTREPPRTLSTS